MQNEQMINLKGVVVTKGNICDLIGELKKYYDNCSINITYKNNISKTKLSIEEFKKEQFENMVIKNLEIRLFDSEHYENSFYFDNFIFDEYYIKYSNNDYEKFSTIKNILEEWLKINNKHKEIVTFAHSFWPIILFFLLVYIPSSILLGREFKETTLFLYSFSVSIICFMIAFGLQSFLRFIFPKTLIDIGYCKGKVVRKRLGWTLIVVIIPLIISIITAIIF